MRVCLVTRALPLHRAGGLEHHTHDLALGLCENGCDVHCVTTLVPEGASFADLPYALHTVPGSAPGDYSWPYFRNVLAFVKALQERMEFDIVHAQGFAMMSPLSLGGLPLAVTIHGTLFSETSLYRGYFRTLGLGEKARELWRHKKRILLYPLYRRYLRQAKRLLVDSDFTAKELIRMNPALEARVRKVPLGIRPARYSLENDTKMPERLARECKKGMLFFSLSRLERMKGIDVALRAFALLKEHAWTYYIGGTGRHETALKRLAADLGIADRVKFLGRVPDEELAGWYRAADVFIYPETAQPAFGLVAIEAMLHHAAVVASRAGALTETVSPEVGRLFTAGDPLDLAAALEEILDDPGAVRAMGERAREYAHEHFSYDAMISGTLDVYREVMEYRTEPEMQGSEY